MRRQIFVALCIVSTIIGTMIGWRIGERIGIAQLPPNAWAGDGMGILNQSLNGSGWGALIGLGVGTIFCLLWYFLRWRQPQSIVSQAGSLDDQVWPPPPTNS